MKTLTQLQQAVLTEQYSKFFATVTDKLVYKKSEGIYEFCLNNNPLTDSNAASALERALEQCHTFTRHSYIDMLLSQVIDNPDAC
jgi:hypothetical protein